MAAKVNKVNPLELALSGTAEDLEPASDSCPPPLPPGRGMSSEGHIPHGQQTFCTDVRPQTGFDAFAAITRIQALLTFPKKG